MQKFLETIRNAFALPDLRKKLLYTLLIIVIFRIGAAIPVPFIDPASLKALVSPSNGGGIFGYIDVLTGGAFSKATIFAMSVTPYINASIIIQLLTIAIPYLERLQKEGEVGRKKIAQITRYVTVILGVMQGLFYYIALHNTVVSSNIFVAIWKAVVIIAVFTAGTALMMWLGEQINEKGIGNGISILLFAGIISRVPAAWGYLGSLWTLGGKNYVVVPAILVLVIAVVAAIVFMNNAERRIPVQYAKRVVGRKMYGGQNTFIPIKVTMSGVMPIIFASSIVAIPGTITQLFGLQNNWFLKIFNYTGWVYAIIYFVLIIVFNYFYFNIKYNPH
jgi:preprotein translocase subunit SecY